VVTFPAIPNPATQGETIEEARLMAEDCLRGYHLEVLRETGCVDVKTRRPRA
jgi:predicted RNase H-like HicB family nuclease